MWMGIILIFYFVSIGSFLNVCIYRIPLKISVVFPSSKCPACNHKLSAKDLFPIISFIKSKGRCAYCNAPISKRYPLVEALTGVLLYGLYLKYGLNLMFFLYALVTCVLIVMTFIDIGSLTINDGTVIFIIALSVMFLAVETIIRGLDVKLLLEHVLGFLIGGGLFLLIALVSKGAMGGGDIKLIAAIGLLVGFKNILFIIFMSFVTGAVVSICLICFKNKSRKDAIAFGPFIAISTYIFMICGELIINYYLGFV